ncbi:GNAT family N-acetyltransferase [Vreelandella boliviensis]|uniref:N-acetyltransferase n=1 Tax=Vreelandella boliviensis LC1 TaxID=1072583 RepID=A0ABX4G5J4_9GAMM|nr:GNAT family N-acetyltransferase [Halomonas boliviensis]OZT72985.1 N-acetyltransferase [Halomonas boliviensis LC1]
MKIRQVERNEIDKVLNLIDEYDRPRSPWPSDGEVDEIYNTIFQCGGCVIGVFTLDKMIGTCTVNCCANLSWSGRSFAIIENVIVSKDYRNKGVGKALLGYAVSHSKETGCYKVALMTGSKDPATHGFYEAAGFYPTKQGYQIRFFEQ